VKALERVKKHRKAKMAIIKIKAIRDSGSGELKSKLSELKLELMKLNFQRASKSVSNPGKIKEIRKSIARILTVMNAKQGKETPVGREGREGKKGAQIPAKAQEKKVQEPKSRTREKQKK